MPRIMNKSGGAGKSGRTFHTADGTLNPGEVLEMKEKTWAQHSGYPELVDLDKVEADTKARQVKKGKE